MGSLAPVHWFDLCQVRSQTWVARGPRAILILWMKFVSLFSVGGAIPVANLPATPPVTPPDPPATGADILLSSLISATPQLETLALCCLLRLSQSTI